IFRKGCDYNYRPRIMNQSKSEYLKRYLVKDPRNEDKKAKRKRIKSHIDSQASLRIVDDDVDIWNSKKHLKTGMKRKDSSDDESPIVAAVIDDRPWDIKRKEIYSEDRWKRFGGHEKSKRTENQLRHRVRCADDDTCAASSDNENNHSLASRRKNRRHDSDSDASIDKYHDHNSRKSESSSDGTSGNLPDKEILHDSDSDRSVRLRNADSTVRSSDQSPQRKKESSSNDDQSPSREARNNSSDSDQSPPRISKRNDSDSDQPPLRKSRNDSDSDQSPPRQSRRNDPDSDQSPPRKSRRNDPDSDQSPPRESRRNDPDSDQSPPRKSRRNDPDSDQSPPRKSRRNDPDSDQSPPRKATDRDRLKRRQQSHGNSDHRQVALGKIDDANLHHSQKNKKPEKTLEGLKAGLQSARSMREDIRAIKERDDIMITMNATELGKGAMPQFRKKAREKAAEKMKAKKEKEEKDAMLQEIYSKWGKGIKQVQIQGSKVQTDLYEMSKPLTRYADDDDLEREQKEKEFIEDPMYEYM
ncbi:BUD13 (predicted), partial [Pycnogonum litorale]